MNKLEMLISSVNAEGDKLIEKMHIACDGVLINQCGRDGYYELPVDGGTIRVFEYAQKGVGVSRNHAIDEAKGDIFLFADEDIVYDDGYVSKVLDEFTKHPEADLLFFNIRVCDERRTYYNTDFARCHIYNAGRYPAYSIAVRGDKLRASGVHYSTLFGGGAKYSCGEDSIFIKDCLKAGLRLYRTPVEIGEEVPRPSTWFTGYNEKFFFDRGVMYHFLYGVLAGVFGFRFVYTKKKEMCRDIPANKAFKLLLDGIKEGKRIDHD